MHFLTFFLILRDVGVFDIPSQLKSDFASDHLNQHENSLDTSFDDFSIPDISVRILVYHIIMLCGAINCFVVNYRQERDRHTETE